MEARRKLTLDELTETSEFQQLTEKQRLFVSTYCDGGLRSGVYDPISATQIAYKCKNAESARVMSYAMMANIRVVEALNRHFNSEPIEDFLKELNRAIRNRKLTIAQLQALKLKADLLGFSARLPGTSNQTADAIPKDVSAATKAARKAKRNPPTKRPVIVKTVSDDYGFNR